MASDLDPKTYYNIPKKGLDPSVKMNSGLGLKKSDFDFDHGEW